MSCANAKSSIIRGGVFHIDERCKGVVLPPEYANEIALGEIGENAISVHKNGIEINKGRTTYVVEGKAGREVRIARDQLRTVSARAISKENTPTKSDRVK